jgi:hypothetical protein
MEWRGSEGDEETTASYLRSIYSVAFVEVNIFEIIADGYGCCCWWG